MTYKTKTERVVGTPSIIVVADAESDTIIRVVLPDQYLDILVTTECTGEVIVDLKPKADLLA